MLTLHSRRAEKCDAVRARVRMHTHTHAHTHTPTHTHTHRQPSAHTHTEPSAHGPPSGVGLPAQMRSRPRETRTRTVRVHVRACHVHMCICARILPQCSTLGARSEWTAVGRGFANVYRCEVAQLATALSQSHLPVCECMHVYLQPTTFHVYSTYEYIVRVGFPRVTVHVRVHVRVGVCVYVYN